MRSPPGAAPAKCHLSQTSTSRGVPNAVMPRGSQQDGHPEPCGQGQHSFRERAPTLCSWQLDPGGGATEAALGEVLGVGTGFCRDPAENLSGAGDDD